MKVPTVASNVGAFQRMIVSGETGILCDTEEEWVEQLSRLVEDKKERDRIAENAHKYCTKKCVTVYTGFPLVKFIKKYTTPNIAFIHAFSEYQWRNYGGTVACCYASGCGNGCHTF